MDTPRAPDPRGRPTAPSPSIRRAVAIALLVLIVTLGLTRIPAARRYWLYIAHEVAESPDGRVVMVYRWDRHAVPGRDAVAEFEYWVDGVRGSGSGSRTQALMAITVELPSGEFQTYIFPGNQGGPEFIGSTPPPTTLVERIWEERTKLFPDQQIMGHAALMVKP